LATALLTGTRIGLLTRLTALVAAAALLMVALARILSLLAGALIFVVIALNSHSLSSLHCSRLENAIPANPFPHRDFTHSNYRARHFVICLITILRLGMRWEREAEQDSSKRAPNRDSKSLAASSCVGFQSPCDRERDDGKFTAGRMS
jgi:hypothetical protein